MARTGTRTATVATLAVAGIVLLAIGATMTLAAWLTAAAATAPAERAPTTEAEIGASTRSTSAGFVLWGMGSDGQPFRWDPCAPIDLVVNDVGAPAGWRADFDAAIEVIEAASPARLRIAASTDEGPSPDRASFQPDRYGDRWAPVLVAWASADTFDVLRGHDRGVAIPVAVGATDTRVFVTGQVVFPRDRDDLQVGADDRAAAWRATFLHELLHLLGLAHVDDADAMMHRYPGAGPIALSDGDRAGLKAVTSGDCITPPEPRHVRVNTLLP